MTSMQTAAKLIVEMYAHIVTMMRDSERTHCAGWVNETDRSVGGAGAAPGRMVMAAVDASSAFERVGGGAGL